MNRGQQTLLSKASPIITYSAHDYLNGYFCMNIEYMSLYLFFYVISYSLFFFLFKKLFYYLMQPSLHIKEIIVIINW